MTFWTSLLAGLLISATTTVAAVAGEAPRGATGCLGCHATKPGIEGAAARVNGRNASDILAAMQAYASGQKPSTVMARIAKGFSDAESKAIADWLSEQP